MASFNTRAAKARLDDNLELYRRLEEACAAGQPGPD